MNIYISQLYIEPGVTFPFSHQMQVFMSRELSAIATPTVAFSTKYGADFNLIVRISARVGLETNEVKGPTVFKKDRDVEYTVFLPFDAIMRERDGCRAAASYLLNGVRTVFEKSSIEAQAFDRLEPVLVDRICRDSEMLETSWPPRSG